MKKKGWSLVFSGLCLALVFSVSSVAVAAPCDTCAKCDQDGDGDIRQTTFCDRKCPIELDRETEAQDQPPGICPVDGDGGGATTFTVEVFFNPGSGFETIGTSISGVVGKIHGNRHNLGENPMTVDITGLTPPVGCAAMFTGADSATFTLHTATIPPSEPELTFISPGLGAIPGTIISQVERFALRFDGGAIADPTAVPDCDDDATVGPQPAVDDWFPGPGDTTCFFGNTITWGQHQSPTDAVCNGEVGSQPWRIGITGE